MRNFFLVFLFGGLVFPHIVFAALSCEASTPPAGQEKDWQQALVSSGQDLGKYGPNGDGVDGIWGPKSELAYENWYKDNCKKEDAEGATTGMGTPEGAFSLKDALGEHQILSYTMEKLTPKFLPGARGSDGSALGGKEMQGTSADVTSTVQKAINTLIGFAGVIAVLFFVWHGAVLVFSVGGSDEITKAKKGLTWSAVGLVVIIFAYVVVKSIIAITYVGG